MNNTAPFSTNELIRSYATFEELEQMALKVFEFQFSNNEIYSQYCQQIGRTTPKSLKEIPFLPISFFKSHRVSCMSSEAIIFTSSGTTSNLSSRHFVYDLEFYTDSFRKTFELFYGKASEYSVLALLPSYLERTGSSLIYMVEDLIGQSKEAASGFFLYDFEKLNAVLEQNMLNSTKTLLIGVSFALLDFAEKYQLTNNNICVMETGGMKGRKKELLRTELHSILKQSFGVQHIHSEYGMTELLSQAYSGSDGIFKTPPWMKVLIREQDDPFSYCKEGISGGINVMDLANVYSCSFISTDDLGKSYEDDSFEVLGRFDASEVRGCNLLIS